MFAEVKSPDLFAEKKLAVAGQQSHGDWDHAKMFR